MRTNRILITFLVIVVLCLSDLNAQTPTNRLALGGQLSFINYIDNIDSDLPGFTQFNPGGRIFASYHVAKPLNITLGVTNGAVYFPYKTDNFYRPEHFIGVDLRVEGKLFGGSFMENETGGVQPYIFAGIQPNFIDGNMGLNVPAGLGLKFAMAENTYLVLESAYNYKLSHDIDEVESFLHTSLGFGVNLNKGIPKPPDTDGDGIADADDKCPKEAGVESNMGCPEPKDSDGDGIADDDDECPNVEGKKFTKGCPDDDLDGVRNSDDKCPDVEGSMDTAGCPDSDEDGVADDDDECPDEAGKKKNKGCPEAEVEKEEKKKEAPKKEEPKAEKDTDGDGVADATDACPNEAGAVDMKGCPDRDGDGYADKDDACPDKKGTEKGCPPAPKVVDSDSDGVEDSADKCPNLAGVASNSGCPEIAATVQEELKVAAKRIQFESGSAVLKSSSYTSLDQVVKILNDYPSYSVRVSGHTDNTGDAGKNLTLSEKRAQAAATYLTSKGVSGTRVSSIGSGSNSPIADNTTASGRALNRRVELELYLP